MTSDAPIVPRSLVRRAPWPWPVLDLQAGHVALSVLRIVNHLAVFWLVLDLWLWREVAFFGSTATAGPLLMLSLLVNALLVVGLHTRPLLVANWALLRLLFRLCLDPYTVDEVVENFSFVLMFSPRPQRLSLDSHRRAQALPGQALPQWFTLLVFTALALLYADSARHKLQAEIWLRGSAFWLGATLPHFAPWWSPGVPQVAWLMKACTWGALAYEILFPLALLRRCRSALVALGLLMHMGTAIFFPLPQFGLVMIAPLLLFVRWERLAVPAPGPVPPPAPRERWTTLGGYALSGLMMVSQLVLNLCPADRRNPLSWVMGTYPHPIFVDWHFRILQPLPRFTTRVEGAEAEIPSFDGAGRPTTRDRYWKVVGFSMRTDSAARAMRERYLTGWFRKSDLTPRTVDVLCRDVFVSNLALDFRTARQINATPWVPCGVVRFSSTAAAPTDARDAKARTSR